MMPTFLPKFLPSLVICAAAVSPKLWADCNTLLPSTTPNSQFSLINPTPDSAVVRDDKTGLMWQRCSLGQRWDGSNQQCLNDNSQPFNFTWTQALAAAASSRYAGYDHWRLPNKKELGSILDLHCLQPAINSSLFPDAPSGRYWSSTPVIYSDQFYAWYVDFKDGGYGNLANDNNLWVRLVRDD